jgi:hypothetical protein
MTTEAKMDWLAFFLWLIGLSIITYTVGYLSSFALLLLFVSDNIHACRRLEKMGFTDWWKNQ